MMLWLLLPTEKGECRVSYDCYGGHVVRAGSAHEARQLCPHGDEGRDFWTHPDLSTCERLPELAPESGVILSSFHAG